MPRPFAYTRIYNSIEKAEKYWQQLKPLQQNNGSYREKWLNQAEMLDQISGRNGVVVLLWDNVLNRFIYMCDKTGVFGHDPSLYLAEDGIDFSLSNVHPEHLTAGLLTNKQGIECYFHNPSAALKNTICNIEILYRRKGGTYFKMLQQAIVVEMDEDGTPLLFLNYVQDISHLKKDNYASMVVSSQEDYKIWNYNFDKRILEEAKPFSEQEQNVLQHLSIGKQSKEIADMLHISPHTVDTHRRNLLKKTNCINTTALVTYSRTVGLIKL